MKFENTEVFNFEGAIRGLRNPMDSWGLSDSNYCIDIEELDCDSCNRINSCDVDYSYTISPYVIGEKDLNLAQRMIKGGTTHSKFIRQIMVSVDITAPRYFFSEFDTYKIGTTANSCSTMHKLTAYPIKADMFELDGIEGELKESDFLLKFEIIQWWNDTIELLEKIRQKERETKDFNYKYIMKQMLPEGFLQKRTVTLNYEVIRHMIQSRSHHKLKEWNTDFINWAKSLPYSKELLFYELKYESNQNFNRRIDI